LESKTQEPFSRHHAVVTGGGRGIGAAIAEALARLGASVSLVGRNAEVLQATANRITKDYGVKVATASANVADDSAVQKAIANVRDVLGAPTILVNNAGVAESAPFLKSDAAFWRKVLDVDLLGAVYCTQAVLPAMLESKWGRIINIASTAGVTGYAYITTYCAAKHGMIGLTRALAIETASKGVTVNAVCPVHEHRHDHAEHHEHHAKDRPQPRRSRGKPRVEESAGTIDSARRGGGCSGLALW